MSDTYVIRRGTQEFILVQTISSTRVDPARVREPDFWFRVRILASCTSLESIKAAWQLLMPDDQPFHLAHHLEV